MATALLADLGKLKARKLFWENVHSILFKRVEGSQAFNQAYYRPMKRAGRYLGKSGRASGRKFIRPPDYADGSITKQDFRTAINRQLQALQIASRQPREGTVDQITIIARDFLPSYYIEKEAGSYGSARRSITNLHTLALELGKFGSVTVLQPETLGVTELVSVIQASDILLGQHGAGLTNMVWLRPGSHVVELQSPKDPPGAFDFLAELAEIEHKKILALVANHGPVDVSQVRGEVQKIIAKR